HSRRGRRSFDRDSRSWTQLSPLRLPLSQTHLFAFVISVRIRGHLGWPAPNGRCHSNHYRSFSPGITRVFRGDSASVFSPFLHPVPTMRTAPFLAAFLPCTQALPSAFALDIPAERHNGGFAVGTQAYTFREFTAMEAIERTPKAGGRVIEFYPGQRFSPEKPDLRWDHDATEEMIKAIEAQ